MSIAKILKSILDITKKWFLGGFSLALHDPMSKKNIISTVSSDKNVIKNLPCLFGPGQKCRPFQRVFNLVEFLIKDG